MPALKYRYYCTFQATQTELTAYGDWKIVEEKEGEQIFKRRKLSGTLLFKGTDYTYFKDILDGVNSCDEISFQIQRSCNNGKTYSSFWNGYFTANDGSFNVDKCTFEVTPKIDDEYRCLIEKKEVEVNILETPFTSTVFADYTPSFQTTTCGPTTVSGVTLDTFNSCLHFAHDIGSELAAPSINSSGCISPGVGWTLYSTKYDNAVNPSIVDVTTTWIREVKSTRDTGGDPNPPAGDGWINIGSTTIGGQPATTWARPPYNGAYTTYEWTLDTTPGECFMEAVLELPESNDVTYTNGRDLGRVIDYMISELCPDITYSSDFFATNPTGDAEGYVVGENYVTGDTNLVNRLRFFQKSDFISPNNSEKARIAYMTFEGLMEILRAIFNCYWVIKDGKLRVEHLSYFTNVVGLDLTVSDYDQYTSGTNSFSFAKANMPRYEVFKWMEVGDIDFVGEKIYYNSACVEGNITKTYSANLVTTDIDFIFNNPNNISKEGFVLVAVDVSANVINAIGEISGLTKSNGTLSWANLHVNYHKHGRVLIEGNMNGADTTFLSAKRTKQQSPFKFPMCCDTIDSSKDITTMLGNGQIEKSEYDPKTGMLKVELIYD